MIGNFFNFSTSTSLALFFLLKISSFGQNPFPDEDKNDNLPPGRLNTSSSHGSDKSYVEVIDSLYHYAEGLRVICNGHLAANGDCNPNVLVGLLKMNSAGRWDTLVDVKRLGSLFCGPTSSTWNHDTLVIQLPTNYYLKTRNEIEYDGQYKLTFLEFKKGKQLLRSSNSFSIAPSSLKNNLKMSPTGFYDSTEASSYQYYKLGFYHMRVFTTSYGNICNVWHKLRIKKRYEDKYIFDQVLNYSIIPYSQNNETIAYGDYNLDGRTDFKITSFTGHFVDQAYRKYQNELYYLYDPDAETFVYSDIYSKAITVNTDSEAHTLIATYSREVPLEGTYHYEAIFSLPDLHLYYLNRLYNNGTTKVPVDTSEFFLGINLTLPETPQPEIHVLYGDTPEAITIKKHYFPNDSVFLITNGMGSLKDITKLNFVLEKKNGNTTDWIPLPENTCLKEKSCSKTDSGYKMKVGDVGQTQISEADASESLLPGTYRINIMLGENLVAQTPEFYVHE